jgi:hypothetical protein
VGFLSTVWRRVVLNYGYVVVYVNGYFDVHYSVPGFGVDLVKIRVDDSDWGLLALADKLDYYAKTHVESAESYDWYISKLKEDWCLAECVTGAWLIYPPPNACEKAKSACEAFQGGFKRLVTIEELEELKKRELEIAENMRKDADTLRTLYYEAPKPPPITPPPTPVPVPTPPPPVVTPPITPPKPPAKPPVNIAYCGAGLILIMVSMKLRG